MMNTCKLCAYGGTPSYKSPCSECFDFSKWEEKEKPKTKADHIRAMSDEELVNVVPCPKLYSMFGCTKEIKCRDCKRGWLTQPYKENE